MRRIRWLLGFIGVTGALTALVIALNLRGEAAIRTQPGSFVAQPEQVERGRYLSLAGNCAGCHTARGGEPFAGGREIFTPFGTVYSSNLTPDAPTGLGDWTADHFWRAMHNGRSRDGRLLLPAFPYPSYTQVRREDSDAIFAYLRSLSPVRSLNRPHALEPLYRSQAALAVWRALFFAPGVYQPQPDRTDEWNRGAYLVKGLGHCIACHGPRNALGATSKNIGLGGGMLVGLNWYAPSLYDRSEAGVAYWGTDEVVELLRKGISARGSVIGPMAEVVKRSTQHLTNADLQAIAVFLKDLPALDRPRPGDTPRPSAEVLADAAKLYESHCAACHGDAGQGAPGAYPALAGNRAVTMTSPVNLIRIVQGGGFPPATAGNPRPYGMPPFAHVLRPDEIAAVLTYIRASWGNDAPPVTQLQVLRQ